MNITRSIVCFIILLLFINSQALTVQPFSIFQQNGIDVGNEKQAVVINTGVTNLEILDPETEQVIYEWSVRQDTENTRSSGDFNSLYNNDYGSQGYFVIPFNHHSEISSQTSFLSDNNLAGDAHH